MTHDARYYSLSELHYLVRRKDGRRVSRRTVYNYYEAGVLPPSIMAGARRRPYYSLSRLHDLAARLGWRVFTDYQGET